MMIDPRASRSAALRPLETKPPGLSTTVSRESSLDSRLRISRVPSSDIPSATITSKPPGISHWSNIEDRQRAMWSISFLHGMMTETDGDVFAVLCIEANVSVGAIKTTHSFDVAFAKTRTLIVQCGQRSFSADQKLHKETTNLGRCMLVD
jgi:hypothetical protein